MDDDRAGGAATDARGPAVSGSRPALARRRQAYILERVREVGSVRVTDLADLLGVSDMTIRRDLEQLHGRGLVEKVHGGATSVQGSALFEPGFVAKSEMMQSEKALIAAAGAALVEPGTAIAISAGTTTFALARNLVDVPGLTVLTNSVPVADVLHKSGRSDQTVILSGGVRTPSDALVGPFAVDVIRSLHVDSVFMGVHGMDPRSGLTTPNILEAATNRALIEAGRRLVVLADHTKWGVVGISSIARMDEADTLITDDQLETAGTQRLASLIRRLILVNVAAGTWRTIERRRAADEGQTPDASRTPARAAGSV